MSLKGFIFLVLVVLTVIFLVFAVKYPLPALAFMGVALAPAFLKVRPRKARRPSPSLRPHYV